ncbi:tryptophan--tRNA ligase [Candidatus Saccharibacteria bacterium]|nr:tryptophan--tRNA ligase [Candidatus Saccharibacteria bacterium]
MKTILTGIRSNSVMTLGNYLGAMLPMVRLANKYSGDYEVNIFVPDLHSVISEVDGDLKENTLRTLKSYLAAGLEINDHVHLYRQSCVPAHSELCWLLNCIATMGEMSRMTQYKDKSEGKESCNVGIFDYPVLMAADILLYSAEYIPLGEDQFQHIELARNLALRFNHKFNKDVFTIPAATADQVKFMGERNGIRIRDLVNPEKKMSKSTRSENAKIMMDDDPAVAMKKIMSATTDSVGIVHYDLWAQPGISNLLTIEALIHGRSIEDVTGQWLGVTRYGDLKRAVAASVADELTSFQSRLSRVSDDEIYELLDKGEKYANSIASSKLSEVQACFGLR